MSKDIDATSCGELREFFHTKSANDPLNFFVNGQRVKRITVDGGPPAEISVNVALRPPKMVDKGQARAAKQASGGTKKGKSK